MQFKTKFISISSFYSCAVIILKLSIVFLSESDIFTLVMSKVDLMRWDTQVQSKLGL